MNKLYQIHPEIEPSLSSFLKLHKALKKRGLDPKNVQWFVNAIEMGVVKLPEQLSLQNRRESTVPSI